MDEGRSAVPERGGAGCEGMPSLEPRSDDCEEGVAGYWYSELRDLGRMAGASGEATYDAAGQPISYVAVAGDSMWNIANRFCIDHYPYLEWINAIRRGDMTSTIQSGDMPVFAGDTINLDPYTIASVGDQNGVVHENEIDSSIPQQR